MCVEKAMEKAEERGEKSRSGSVPAVGISAHLESICENTVAIDIKHKDMDENQKQMLNFVPTIRCGEWSDIGKRNSMEDTHVCIADLAKKFGRDSPDGYAVSFYGVFDGHDGNSAAHFVRDNLPRVIVEDAHFPLELAKVVPKSFKETDAQFAQTQSALSSGTTAIAAMIFGRSLLVANAGDCRAVLSRNGMMIEMSTDHRPCCKSEKRRIESLGGNIDKEGYLNGELGVTRALGDWHLKEMKVIGDGPGPLSAEPELKMITLTKDDEFLIIASDGLWDVFRSQNAVDFVRRRLQEHNDVKMCCRELVEEAKKRESKDNLTALIVCFKSDPPPPGVVGRPRIRRVISPEGLQDLQLSLES